MKLFLQALAFGLENLPAIVRALKQLRAAARAHPGHPREIFAAWLDSVLELTSIRLVPDEVTDLGGSEPLH